LTPSTSTTCTGALLLLLLLKHLGISTISLCYLHRWGAAAAAPAAAAALPPLLGHKNCCTHH
jgi:hypothetical protein